MTAIPGISAARPHATTTEAPPFADFFQRSFQQVVGLVTLTHGSPVLAEDCAQEAFARALDRWGRVGRMDRPDRWVLRVALNLAVDHHRRTRREAGLGDEERAAVPDEVERLWVRWHLARLTPMQRVAVVLRHVDGMPVADVATTLGRSPETVRTHLRLARRRLREQMAGER